MSTDRLKQNLRRLLKPKHIAFVGGQALISAIKVTQGLGFNGPIWVVNPHHAEIGGCRCYRSVADLPEPPDASYVAVPREVALKVIGELAARGAGGAVCHAAGFAEIGAPGRKFQSELIAAAGDMAVMGPNCTGFVNYLERVAVISGPQGGLPVARGAAVIAQSGTITLNAGMSQRSVDITHLANVGNEAVLRVAHFIEAFVDDPRVAAIGIALEGLRDLDEFARAARAARARRLPIVILKSGRTELGAQSALSHTGAMAGADRVYDDFFERLGIVRVNSLPVLLETLKLLSVLGPLESPRVAVVTCSGFEAGLAADVAQDVGLSLPAFSDTQSALLQKQLPPYASVANPLDYHMAIWADRAAQEQCFRTILSGPFDLAAIVANYPKPGFRDVAEWTILIDALIAAKDSAAVPTAFLSSLPEGIPEDVRRRLIASGIAPIQGIDDGLAAIAAAARYADISRTASDNLDLTRQHLPVSPLAGKTRMLDEWESKQLISSFGIRTPRGYVFEEKSGNEIAGTVRFPAVVKALSSLIPHKTEAGAIEVGLATALDVQESCARIKARALARKGIRVDRFLIEEAIEDSVAELIVGVKRQPPFGLTLLIGAGGVLAEFIADVQELVLPTTEQRVHRALSRLKLFKVLSGYRSRPRADLDALVAAVMSVGRLAQCYQDELIELDINPLMALPEGKGVIAADALIVMAATADSKADMGS